MSINEKIKAINNNIEQNKVHYDLYRQTAKISALQSGNVSKYEFLTDKGVLVEKDLLEKAAALKKCEYSPLAKELKHKRVLQKKQYQKLDKVFQSDKKEEKILKSCAKSNLVYSKDFTYFLQIP